MAEGGFYAPLEHHDPPRRSDPAEAAAAPADYDQFPSGDPPRLDFTGIQSDYSAPSKDPNKRNKSIYEYDERGAGGEQSDDDRNRGLAVSPYIGRPPDLPPPPNLPPPSNMPPYLAAHRGKEEPIYAEISELRNSQPGSKDPPKKNRLLPPFFRRRKGEKKRMIKKLEHEIKELEDENQRILSSKKKDDAKKDQTIEHLTDQDRFCNQKVEGLKSKIVRLMQQIDHDDYQLPALGDNSQNSSDDSYELPTFRDNVKEIPNPEIPVRNNPDIYYEPIGNRRNKKTDTGVSNLIDHERTAISGRASSYV